MKTLKDTLFETCQFSQIGIDESMAEPRSIWAGKAEAKIIQDKLQIFLKGQKTKVSLTNKSELGKFFKAFVATLTFGNTVKNLQVLKEYGMGSEQGFASVVLGNQKEFEEKKWDTSCIKNFDLSQIEKEYKKAKDNDEIPDSIDLDDADERDIVIYDRWDPEHCVCKPFKGKRGKQSDHQINMLRMDFHYEEGVKYYDCYPILVQNYVDHLEEIKKRAELGIMDMAAYQQI